MRDQGYTGKILLLCSDDDKTIPRYKELYGDDVKVFNKDEYGRRFDTADNFDNKKVIFFARNAAFDIAEENGYDYFLEMDDDYTKFRYTTNEKGEYITKNDTVRNLDKSIESLLKFYKSTNIKTICMAQGGDFIGGEGSGLWKKKIGRKAMNSFICSPKRRFSFLGRINEDVNTYVHQGSVGDLFFTICDLRLEQLETQSNEGGMTESYRDGGTYVKSFYTVMFAPSCTVINLMGNGNYRLHHQIKWGKAVPCILDEKYKR